MYRSGFVGALRQRWATLSQFQQIAVAVVGLLVLYWLLVSGGGLLNPARLLAMATIIFVAFPVHEFAHAAAAVALGDDLPKRQGRYTLNPLVHIDPLGAALIFFTGFGWAKPVQWNPRAINVDVKLGSMIVALAGPLSNLVMAVLAGLVIKFGGITGGFLYQFLAVFVAINVLLFVFNLLPIPPLDGSHVLFALLPGNNFRLQAQLTQYGFLILLAVVFIMPGVIQVPAQWLMHALLGL